jgi:hypothetical protein
MVIYSLIKKINNNIIIYNNDKGYFINQRIVIPDLRSTIFIEYQRKSKRI